MQYTYQEITKISREFRDLATDLLNSNESTFDTSLNYFKAFCDEQSVIQTILQPIIENQFDTQTWYKNATENQSSMVGSGDPTLPLKQIDALRAIYDILWDKNAKNLCIEFIYNTMLVKNFDEMIRRFNDNFTKRLIRYVLRKLEDEIELIKPQNLPLGNTFNTFNGPTNYATHSNNVKQTVQINNPDLIAIINEMRDVIEKSALLLSDKQDALETVDLIEQEANKPNPSKSRMTKLLTLLPIVDSLTSLGNTLISNIPV